MRAWVFEVEGQEPFMFHSHAVEAFVPDKHGPPPVPFSDEWLLAVRDMVSWDPAAHHLLRAVDEHGDDEWMREHIREVP